MSALTDEEMYGLRRDYGHAFTIGHDDDGAWWATRLGHKPFEAQSADGLRGLLAEDEARLRADP